MKAKESSSNIEFTCEKHSRKPDPKYAKKPVDFFLGKFVKKAFPGVDPKGNLSKEHMWVRVVLADKGVLVGTLDNHPIFEMDLKYGSTVKVKRSEIEQVFDRSTGQIL